jgi:hypothetical protein
MRQGCKVYGLILNFGRVKSLRGKTHRFFRVAETDPNSRRDLVSVLRVSGGGELSHFAGQRSVWSAVVGGG